MVGGCALIVAHFAVLLGSGSECSELSRQFLLIRPPSPLRACLMAASSSSHPMSGDTSTTSTAATLAQHVELWFSDGSVVLQAESTLFRVHKSQLARRSVVFSDMFTLPQPVVSTSHATFSDESHEGCPVVRLHDTAADVANLLLALYDGPYVFSWLPRTIQLTPSRRTFGDNDPDDFAIVSGILRLSTKYAMDSLRSKAIAHLNIAWPPTLKGWDLREDKAHACDLASSAEHASLYPSPIVCSPRPFLPSQIKKN